MVTCFFWNTVYTYTCTAATVLKFVLLPRVWLLVDLSSVFDFEHCVSRARVFYTRVRVCQAWHGAVWCLTRLQTEPCTTRLSERMDEWIISCLFSCFPRRRLSVVVVACYVYKVFITALYTVLFNANISRTSKLTTTRRHHRGSSSSSSSSRVFI